MNLPSSQGLSFYQLALDSLEAPQTLRVSPDILHSLLGALIDVLIEGKIPATLWVKLPPAEIWLTELKRYQQQVNASNKIFLCNWLREDLVEVRDGVEQATNVKEDSQFFSIQLATGPQLGQEYFLLVLSEQISGLIVACQTYQSESSTAARWHPNQPLSAIFTFEPRVIHRVFEGIKEAIAVDDSLSEEILELWETRLPQGGASDEKEILTQLLVKQLQHTEAILHPPIPSDLSLQDAVNLNATTKLTPVLDPTPTTPPPPDNCLRDKDELLKRVIQELRTPLTSMKTALKLLDAVQLKPIQRQRYIQLLNTECDRQNSLMTGFLELVQLESEPQPSIMPSVQLADIVPGVVSTYQAIAQEKGIRLDYTIPSDLPSVSCLDTWLRQILINLLHNSLKFTPAGGQVTVQATLQGEYIQLAFDDTGIGLATHEIPIIFDIFYRGRSTISENTGAGLGLTIVQHLLLRCGGSISVTSRLGEGSSFKVLLLVASPTAPLCQGRK